MNSCISPDNCFFWKDSIKDAFRFNPLQIRAILSRVLGSLKQITLPKISFSRDPCITIRLQGRKILSGLSLKWNCNSRFEGGGWKKVTELLATHGGLSSLALHVYVLYSRTNGSLLSLEMFLKIIKNPKLELMFSKCSRPQAQPFLPYWEV